MLLADSRYTIQARREAPDTRIAEVYGNLEAALAGPRRARSARAGSRSRPGFVPQATWARLAAAAPDVELVPVEGWLEADRATKEPAELERVAAACAVADRALAALLPEIRPGVTEHDLALRLEWLMRTGGADALAFDVACLAGSGGGPAARVAGRATRARPGGAALRLRGAGRPATGAT